MRSTVCNLLKRRSLASAASSLPMVLFLLLAACNASRLEDRVIDEPLVDMRSGKADLSIPPPLCKGRTCQVPKCPDGSPTEIVGKVFAGNGADPVPAAAVFIPVFDLPEFPSSLGCDLCNDIPVSVASTQTDFDGSFRLRYTPSGSQPVVVRLGRFQRVVTMDIVPCTENTIPADPGTSGKGVRLPRKTGELSSQDNLPRIAVASGDYDQIECVLKRIGIDEVDLFNGRSPGATNPPTIAELSTLLTDEKRLLRYNILIINCTDNQYQSLLSQSGVKATLEKFVRSGGRLYVTDWAYDVIEQVPQFSPYICFEPQSLPGPAMCMANPERATAADSRNPYGGKNKVLDPQMVKWLQQFPGTINPNNEVDIGYSFVIVNSTSADPKTMTKTWVQGPTPVGTRAQTVTFDYNSCGRVHFSTYNTEPDGVVNESTRWPNSCKGNFTPQERLLEYLFFNIASCVNAPG